MDIIFFYSIMPLSTKALTIIIRQNIEQKVLEKDLFTSSFQVNILILG